MSPFPSNKIMITTIILVAIGFGFKFINSSGQQFFQLNYDWDKEKPVENLGIARLDSVTYNYVQISGNNFSPNSQNTYKLSNKSDSYYFRYIYALKDSINLKFKGVEWITDIPEITNVEYKIKEVFLPIKEGEGPTVVTIGDRLLIENEAKYYRKDLTSLFPVNFKGQYYDVFDFPFEAVKMSTSTDILSKISAIPKADYYVLMYGANEQLDSSNTLRNNTEEIIKVLQEKKPKKIVLITLPPSKDNSVKQSNSRLNEQFFALTETDGVELIDTYQLFTDNLDKYIREDGITISRDGYYELAKKTSKLIR